MNHPAGVIFLPVCTNTIYDHAQRITDIPICVINCLDDYFTHNSIRPTPNQIASNDDDSKRFTFNVKK